MSTASAAPRTINLAPARDMQVAPATLAATNTPLAPALMATIGKMKNVNLFVQPAVLDIYIIAMALVLKTNLVIKHYLV